MTKRLILKFGGSSVGTPERIQSIIALIRNSDSYPEGCILGVVVSAFQGVTDSLIQIAARAAAHDPSYRELLKALEIRHLQALHELLPATNRSAAIAEVKVLLHELEDLAHGAQLVGECTPRTLDQVMSFGERLSAYIFAQACLAQGLSATHLDTRGIITTDDRFGNAIPDRGVSYPAIRDAISRCEGLSIITGFIGSTAAGVATTLGRGGSDLTAALCGAALSVDAIEIWTDVDGLLTADPRKVPKAFPLPEVSFDEAMELCHFGAKVIYPPTMQPAIDAHIPLIIRNTLNPTASGTRIVNHAERHAYPITGISSISPVALIRLQGAGMVGVPGTAARFFGALAQADVNVILITQASSEHTICCAIDPRSVEAARQSVNQAFLLEIKASLLEPLHIELDLAVVSVVGDSMRHSPGTAGRVFSALGSNGVNVVAIAQGSSERNISTVVASIDEGKALQVVHDEFFVNRTKTAHLWLAGTGNIGSVLLQQIAKQRSHLRETLGLDLQLYGITNSRRMKIRSRSTRPFAFESNLDHDSIPSSLSEFVADCVAANLPNSVFIDCTASDDVPAFYARLLERNIAVVTPNKRGFSSSLEFYQMIRASSESRRTPLLHETCVGAALPILGTLNDLVRSGDTVLTIDAVLSGTLSFIFSALRSGTPFSEAIREAMARGYTEPDPRDDLSGLDVARKVLILARDAELPLELSDISLNSPLPEELRSGSVEDFLKALPSVDRHFEQLTAAATAENKRLFFGAHIDCERRVATIGLHAVGLHHPFCSLSGADNIVAFTTARYRDTPLVIKGPGAGAEVTAAGVFADMIRAVR
jgi:aspartokinase/homoserine dehydrogenase 1